MSTAAVAVNDVDVVIVGAGAAGLMAAYELVDQAARGKLSYAVLEANSRIGGRLQTLSNYYNKISTSTSSDSKDFADFPIDVGGEWIHVHPRVLNNLAWDVQVTDEIETVPEQPNAEQHNEAQQLGAQESKADAVANDPEEVINERS